MNKLSILFLSFALASAVPSLKGDFITGFETGIFMRENENALNEYDCPKPETSNAMQS